MDYNNDFWNAFDSLVQQSVVVIDRPKGTAQIDILRLEDWRK